MPYIQQKLGGESNRSSIMSVAIEYHYSKCISELRHKHLCRYQLCSLRVYDCNNIEEQKLLMMVKM